VPHKEEVREAGLATLGDELVSHHLQSEVEAGVLDRNRSR
jgi:hypothetical protein